MAKTCRKMIQETIRLGGIGGDVMVQDTDMWHYEWNMGLEMLSNLGECGGGMGRRARY